MSTKTETKTIIFDFWISNKQFWISIDNREEADKIIYETFYNYDYSKCVII